MKRIDNTEVWSDGGVKYTKNASGDFEIYIEPTVELEEEDGEDNWTYSEDDFVTLDEPVVLKPSED
tara:strand:+ start:3362 stop:3559 length:198 start_codon:yes stop_codon:yes gene_type:complete